MTGHVLITEALSVVNCDSRTGQHAAHEGRRPAGERLARGEPREAVVDELAVGLAAGDGRGADRDLRRAPDPRGQLLVGVGEPLELVGLCANQAVSQVHFFTNSFLGDVAAMLAKSRSHGTTPPRRRASEI